MDLSDEAIDLTNNWWAVLLSGSAGALIGAMATVAAVVIAFRLEHTRSREERVRAAMSATATRASALGWDWSLGGEPVDGWTREHLDAMRELISSVGNVIDACGAAEPVMRKQLGIIAFGMPEAERKIDGVNALSRFAQQWLRNPDSIRKGEVTAYTIAREIAAEREKKARNGSDHGPTATR